VSEKETTKHRSQLFGIITAFLILAMGSASLYGWWKVDQLYFEIPLYVVSTFLIAIGIFGLFNELFARNHGRADRINYAMGFMFLVFTISILYQSISTDIAALRWVGFSFTSLFGLITLIAITTQAIKDIRSNPTLGWIVAIILIPLPYIFASWYTSDLVILLLIPFTFILFYIEYLRTAFLRTPTKETSPSRTPNPSQTDVQTSYTAIKSKLVPKDILLANLRSVRWPLYLSLMFFVVLFYIVVAYVHEDTYDYRSIYEAIIYAYIAILAIVIAFAILILQRQSTKKVTEPLRQALKALVQMYVIFVLITLTGLLIGTEVDGTILTTTTLGQLFTSIDSFFNICRILALEFTILSFPSGLLYLYAMIKDFLTQ